MLRESRQRATALLDNLVRQKADLEAWPPGTVNPEQLRAGRAAIEGAIDAARRMVQSIDSALGRRQE